MGGNNNFRIEVSLMFFGDKERRCCFVVVGGVPPDMVVDS